MIPYLPHSHLNSRSRGFTADLLCCFGSPDTIMDLVHLEVKHDFLKAQISSVPGQEDFKSLLKSVCAKHMDYVGWCQNCLVDKARLILTQLPCSLSASTLQPATPKCGSALEQQCLQFPQHEFPGPPCYIQYHKFPVSHQPFQLPGCLQDREWSFVGEL